MEPDHVDYKERLYQMFLPEIHKINGLGLLRRSVPVTPHYEESLDHAVAAAALYGVAMRLHLDIVKIEPESPEEYSLRKALRGQFLASLEAMTSDQVTTELREKFGFTEERLAKLAEQCSYKIQEEDEPAEYYETPLADTLGETCDIFHRPERRVTRIDALFRIDGAAGRCATYCRATTFSAGIDDAVFFWEDKSYKKQSYPDLSLLGELTLVRSRKSSTSFLKSVAEVALWLEGNHSREDVRSLVTLLEREFERRKS